MTEETEAQLQQQNMILMEQQRILELKESLKKEEEYRYLMILQEREANQFREKIANQLNSISLQLYDLNKVLANKKGLDVEEENEVPEIEPKEESVEEEPEETEDEVPEIESKEESIEEESVEEEAIEESEEKIEDEVPEVKEEKPKKETKEQIKIRKQIEKLQKKILKIQK